MKKLIALIYFGILFLPLPHSESFAQRNNLDEIVLSIKTGSSKNLAKFFNGTIEMNLIDNQGDFSKNQAEIIFRDFFKKFPALGFEVIHKGESADNFKYYIGSYESQDMTFRVLIKTKLENDQLRIYSLDFNKE